MEITASVKNLVSFICTKSNFCILLAEIISHAPSLRFKPRWVKIELFFLPTGINPIGMFLENAILHPEIFKEDDIKKQLRRGKDV